MVQMTPAYTGTHLLPASDLRSIRRHSRLGVVPASVQGPGRDPLGTSLRTAVQMATVYLCIWSGLGFALTPTTSLASHLVSVNIALTAQPARAQS